MSQLSGVVAGFSLCKITQSKDCDYQFPLITDSKSVAKLVQCSQWVTTFLGTEICHPNPLHPLNLWDCELTSIFSGPHWERNPDDLGKLKGITTHIISSMSTTYDICQVGAFAGFYGYFCCNSLY